MSRPKTLKDNEIKKPRTVKLSDITVGKLLKKSKEENLSKAIREAVLKYLGGKK